MLRKTPWINPLLVGVVVGGLSAQALAQSVPFPTYATGPNPNGPWVVSDGAIITPAGTQVNLGIRVRAKAIALNPTGNHTAAVLTMGTSTSNGNGAVEVFNTQTGAVVQPNYSPFKDTHGAPTGIAYTPDGKYLLFSQDSSFVAVASVNPSTGVLSDYAHVSVPMDVNASGVLTNVTCFPWSQATFKGSPPGTTGSNEIPCGQTVSIVSDGTKTSYPAGIAITRDGKTAYVVLDNNDTLTRIDLTAAAAALKEGPEVRVGQVPHSVVISPDGTTAYVSNEGGRPPTANDFQGYSNGTPVVAKDPTGASATGTVSVVNLSTFTVTDTIETDVHPTGMAFWGNYLLVAHPYSDSISVIDTGKNRVVRKINLGLPIAVPGEKRAAFGAGPNSIAVDAVDAIAYVALYNANAIAVVDLNARDEDHEGDHGDKHDGDQGEDHDDDHGGDAPNAVRGMIPVAYAPSSVVLDAADNVLLVANDKGLGTTGIPPQNSFQSSHGVSRYGTHQDLGTASIVPLPNNQTLAVMTHQVFQNNHWDLLENIASASGGHSHTSPVAIPARIGDPSTIKHVFVIIRENRTYDQILGDVAAGNGDASLAVFGDAAAFGFVGGVTPNAHALVQRFPLLDNFYDPSRQSADGHNWIVQAMAPYSDDIQSPDWLRDYPSNGGEALAYQKKGHLWDVAADAGIKVKNYGEYIEYNTFLTPEGSTTEPSWRDFYTDTQNFESGAEAQLYYFNTVASHTPLPNLYKDTVQNYPQFDLGIPDQFRFDVWNEDFKKDLAHGSVPQLEFMWISSDHTGGPPTAQAMQADNDLALGRFVEAISHSSIWSSSVIFVEEDDAQDGVDHVDGHRSPGYVISPYVKQGGFTDNTYYTQVNMTRTIEQILGMTPMNQFDLVASPMRTLFVNEPPKENFAAWTHVPNVIPLDQGVPAETHVGHDVIPAPLFAHNLGPKEKALQTAWLKKKAEIFAGKYQTPDSENPEIVNHLNWYEATGFMRPYPGEKKVRRPSDFKNTAADGDGDDKDRKDR
jgi:YVTN family beta-propeller protein